MLWLPVLKVTSCASSPHGADLGQHAHHSGRMWHSKHIEITSQDKEKEEEAGGLPRTIQVTPPVARGLPTGPASSPPTTWCQLVDQSFDLWPLGDIQHPSCEISTDLIPSLIFAENPSLSKASHCELFRAFSYTQLHHTGYRSLTKPAVLCCISVLQESRGRPRAHMWLPFHGSCLSFRSLLKVHPWPHNQSPLAQQATSIPHTQL